MPTSTYLSLGDYIVDKKFGIKLECIASGNLPSLRSAAYLVYF